MAKTVLIDNTHRPSKKHNQPQRIAVNQSRVKSWRLCHRQHYYKYEEKLKPKIKKRPFMFGDIVHRMLEAYANSDDPWPILDKAAKSQRKLFHEEIELYGDIVADLRFIMGDYFRYWERHPDKVRYIRFQRKAAEHVFEIELEKGLVWKGKIDAFVKYRGLTGLGEHKTFSREWSEDERWRNLQSLTYRRASKMMGWPVTDGIWWDYIYSKAPTRPTMLKAGGPSSKQIITLPSVVNAFIAENKLKSKDCESLIRMGDEGLSKYFQRLFTPANEAIEEKIYHDFLDTVYEIAEEHDKKKGLNIGKHCGWCEFEALCRTELTDGDVDFVREKKYEIDNDEVVKPTRIDESD